MVNSKIGILYRFLSVKGIGSVQTNKLILSIQDVNNLIEIEQKAKALLDTHQLDEYEHKNSILDNLNLKHKIEFVSLLDESYPEELKKCLKQNTPPILSYIGNLHLLNKKKVGFSGSRNVSEKGLNITKDCVEQLVDQDIAIVSGYAKGVDFMAHYTALKNNGTTIIILPEGINFFSIKKELKEFWDWERILVISEFEPANKWMASRAMKRNNTIIGLCDIVVVIEAGETGGSLDAGDKTIQFGKQLFVPQYGIVPDSALGNSVLIKRGAFPIKMNKETSKANLIKMFEILNSPSKYSLF